MANELKSLIQETIKERLKIEFDLNYFHKGCNVEKKQSNHNGVYVKTIDWVKDKPIKFLISFAKSKDFSKKIL